MLYIINVLYNLVPSRFLFWFSLVISKISIKTIWYLKVLVLFRFGFVPVLGLVRSKDHGPC